jgi:hypothetical protein
LWDHIATFAETPEGAGIDRLRPPQVIRQIVSLTLAHGARPWIVYYGFQDPASQPARREMARILSWSAAHPELFSATPYTPVAVIVSLRERDLFGGAVRCVGQGVTRCYPATSSISPLIPRHLGSLLNAGVPVIALRETQLSPATLHLFRFVTLESGKAISRDEVRALVSWVHAGGFLITNPEAGGYGEVGRKLAQPLLLEALGLRPDGRKARTLGRERSLFPIRSSLRMLSWQS